MTKDVKNSEFLKCLYKTGTQYYKKALFWACVIVIGCSVIYGLAITCMAIIPTVIEVLTSIPAWIYLVVGCLISPGITAIVVCYIRQSKKEIDDVDKDYICPE